MQRRAPRGAPRYTTYEKAKPTWRKNIKNKPQEGPCDLCHEPWAPLRLFDQKFLHHECRAIPDVRAFHEDHIGEAFRFTAADMKLGHDLHLIQPFSTTNYLKPQETFHYYYLGDLLALEKYLAEHRNRAPYNGSEDNPVHVCVNFSVCHNAQVPAARRLDRQVICSQCEKLPPFYIMDEAQVPLRYPSLNLAQAAQRHDLRTLRSAFFGACRVAYYEHEIRTLLGLPPLLTSYWNRKPETQMTTMVAK